MMKFAQESGKSKGQFYTPSEVSRIIARLIGIGDIKPVPDKAWKLYDPACGSGSLLIRAADEAPLDEFGNSLVTISGQEKDHSTAGLATMNLILHQKGNGEIKRGNTLTNPQFKDRFEQLTRFDFVVMNPPFSDKSWSDGLKADADPYRRSAVPVSETDKPIIRKAGKYKGKIIMSDDFDAPLDDFKEYMQ